MDRIGVEVTIPIKIADYEYIKLGTFYSTDIKPGETIVKAYRRAWRIAEKELEKKSDEYSEQLKVQRRGTKRS